MSDIILDIKNLRKYYNSTRGIENVSFSIKKGEIYGFIGPNGAGKSTTIKSIMNLINIDKGTIKILDKDNDKSEIFLKSEIGYLPSEINLYDDLKVKDILDFHEGFYNIDLKANRSRLVDIFKLDESKYIEELSLGNKKKLGIILALMHKPKLLILDEPTSGLDPIMQNIFFELLLEEKARGTTILYSTHILNEVTKICDRIGFIKDGIIIKEDYVKNIIKSSYKYITVSSKEIYNLISSLQIDNYNLIDNNTIKFINNKNINILIKKLADFNIDNLLIEDVDIEEMFLEYYK